MLNVLYKYLVLNKAAGIPGIGNFTIVELPAQVRNASFHSPSTKISFEPGTALADKNFYRFVAMQDEMSEVDAVRKFQDFAYQLKKDIQSKPSIELNGIGVLKRNNLGELIFEPTTHQNYFPVLTPAEVENRPEPQTQPEEETNVVIAEDEQIAIKDRWWIWATVLAVLAIAAIAYFYWQEGL